MGVFARHYTAAAPATTTKEVGVQTYDNDKPRLASPDPLLHQQVLACDSVSLKPCEVQGENGDRDPQSFPSAIAIPLYVNTSPADIDCSCQVHYATYRRPKNTSNHVAGIHKASTMPRKVVFAGEINNIYQQTPL